jgi:hypothetical protein
MPLPSLSSRCYYPNAIGKGIEIVKLLIMYLFLLQFYQSILGPNILLNTLFSYTLSLRSSLNVSDQVSHPYKTRGKIIIMYILIDKCLGSKLPYKGYCTEWQQAFPACSLQERLKAPTLKEIKDEIKILDQKNTTDLYLITGRMHQDLPTKDL